MIKLIIKIISIALILGATSCQFGDDDAMDSYRGDNNPLFVTIGGSFGVFHSYVSSDGVNWVKGGNVNGNYQSITYGNGIFVAVGSNNSIVTSVDGLSWIIRTDAETGINNIDSGEVVIFGNNRFVISTGMGNIHTSYDGINWNFSGHVASFASISFGNGIFFGITDTGGKVDGNIYISTDGITWYNTNNPMTANIGFNDVVYGNTLFVMVGQSWGSSGICLSQNGINWSDNILAAESTYLECAAFGNRKFIAGGEYRIDMDTSVGILYTSQNGFQWNGPITMRGTSIIFDVAYCNGIFVATGGNGFISYSEDGNIWSGNVGPGGNIRLPDIAVRP